MNKEFFLFLFLIAFLITSCLVITDESELQTKKTFINNTLNSYGFLQVDLFDQGAFLSRLQGCSPSEQFYYKAHVVDSSFKRVDILICCEGLMSMKTCTVMAL